MLDQIDTENVVTDPIYPDWMKLKGKRIQVGKREGEVLHDLASQLVVLWSDGKEEYIFKTEKYTIITGETK